MQQDFGASAVYRAENQSAGPFPHIADHVADAVSVRRERGHRRGALVTIELEILIRKRALPSVRHLLAAGREFISPGELRAVEPAAAANSHSASVGKSLPAHLAYAKASR